MRFLSLFAGIGGLDLALEALGHECVGQVEWDPACTRVLERWWPSVPRWGDVREFTAASYARRWQLQRRAERGGMEGTRRADERAARGRGDDDTRDAARDGGAVDLIVGGFPCQPVSQDHIERRSTSTEVLNYETGKSVTLDRGARHRADLLPTPSTSDAKGPSPHHAGTTAEAIRSLGDPTNPPSDDTSEPSDDALPDPSMIVDDSPPPSSSS
jgi:hypothetical protein